MKLSSEDQAWLREYREILSRDFPGLVQQIILFGSKAKGTAKPNSDIDLVIVERPAHLNGDRVLRRVNQKGSNATGKSRNLRLVHAIVGSLGLSRLPFQGHLARESRPLRE